MIDSDSDEFEAREEDIVPMNNVPPSVDRRGGARNGGKNQKFVLVGEESDRFADTHLSATSVAVDEAAVQSHMHTQQAAQTYAFFEGNDMVQNVFDRRQHPLTFDQPYFTPGRINRVPVRPSEPVKQERMTEIGAYGRRKKGEIRGLHKQFPAKIRASEERDKKDKERLELEARMEGPEVKAVQYCNLRSLPEELMFAQDISILQLTGNRIGDLGMSYISGFLQDSTTIRRLVLQANDITAEGCKCLAEGLRTTKTLQDLDISLNPIADDGCGFICNALGENRHSKVYKINMGTCKLTSGSGFHLGRLIRDFKPLTALCLWRNNLGAPASGTSTAGFTRIMDEVRADTRMKLIDLTCNNIRNVEAADHATMRELEARSKIDVEMVRARTEKRISLLEAHYKKKKAEAIWDDDKMELAELDTEIGVEKNKLIMAINFEVKTRTKAQQEEAKFKDKVVEIRGVTIIDTPDKPRLVLTGNPCITIQTFQRLSKFYNMAGEPIIVEWVSRLRRYDNVVIPRRKVGEKYTGPRNINELDTHSIFAADNSFDPNEDHLRRERLKKWKEEGSQPITFEIAGQAKKDIEKKKKEEEGEKEKKEPGKVKLEVETSVKKPEKGEIDSSSTVKMSMELQTSEAETPEQRRKRLGKQLKAWKKEFLQKNGREPTMADIEQNPEILAIYKEYNNETIITSPAKKVVAEKKEPQKVEVEKKEPQKVEVEVTSKRGILFSEDQETETAEQRHKRLGRQLKSWKKEFLSKNGREPSLADIEGDSEIFLVYKQYQGETVNEESPAGEEPEEIGPPLSQLYKKLLKATVSLLQLQTESQLTPDEIEDVHLHLRLVDPDDNGMMNDDMFFTFMKQVVGSKFSESDLWELFSLMDVEGIGYVAVPEDFTTLLPILAQIEEAIQKGDTARAKQLKELLKAMASALMKERKVEMQMVVTSAAKRMILEEVTLDIVENGGFSDDELKTFKMAFAIYDQDGSGKLTEQQFSAFIKEFCGSELTFEQIQEIHQDLTCGTGELAIDDFVQLYSAMAVHENDLATDSPHLSESKVLLQKKAKLFLTQLETSGSERKKARMVFQAATQRFATLPDDKIETAEFTAEELQLLRAQFKLFDPKEKGRMTKQTFLTFMQQVMGNQKLSKKELQDLFSVIDVEHGGIHGGILQFDDFVKLYPLIAKFTYGMPPKGPGKTGERFKWEKALVARKYDAIKKREGKGPAERSKFEKEGGPTRKYEGIKKRVINPALERIRLEKEEAARRKAEADAEKLKEAERRRAAVEGQKADKLKKTGGIGSFRMKPSISKEEAEKQHKALGKQLKAWKKEFAAKNGREPTIADIEADVEMSLVYKEYMSYNPDAAEGEEGEEMTQSEQPPPLSVLYNKLRSSTITVLSADEIEDVHLHLRLVDPDDNGMMNEDMFFTFMKQVVGSKFSESDLHKLFTLVDVEGIGYIQVPEDFTTLLPFLAQIEQATLSGNDVLVQKLKDEFKQLCVTVAKQRKTNILQVLSSAAKRMLLEYETEEGAAFTEHELKAFRMAIRPYDKESTGQLGKLEFFAYMREVYQTTLQEAQFEELWADLTCGTGELAIDDFVQLYSAMAVHENDLATDSPHLSESKVLLQQKAKMVFSEGKLKSSELKKMMLMFQAAANRFNALADNKIDTAEFTAEELQLLRGQFKVFDKKGTGEMTKATFVKYMQSVMGSQLPKSELYNLFSMINVEKNGVIAFDDFLKLFPMIAKFSFGFLNKIWPNKFGDRLKLAAKQMVVRKYQGIKKRGEDPRLAQIRREKEAEALRRAALEAEKLKEQERRRAAVDSQKEKERAKLAALEGAKQQRSEEIAKRKDKEAERRADLEARKEAEILMKRAAIRMTRQAGEDDPNDPNAGFTDQEVEVLQRHFNRIDTDGSGEVDKKEFTEFYLSVMGAQLTKKEIGEIFDKLDADGGGTLSMDEFIKVYKAMMLREAAKKDPNKQKILDDYLAAKVQKAGTALHAVLAFQSLGRRGSQANLQRKGSQANDEEDLGRTNSDLNQTGAKFSLGNKLKSWAKKGTSTTGPEARHKALGSQLKNWKKEFVEQNGRDPTTADIEADPEMATVYKEYTEQQSGEATEETPGTEQDGRAHRRAEIDATKQEEQERRRANVAEAKEKEKAKLAALEDAKHKQREEAAKAKEQEAQKKADLEARKEAEILMKRAAIRMSKQGVEDDPNDPNAGFTAQEVEVLQRHFNRIDTDGSGEVDKKEFTEFYHSVMGSQLTKREIGEIFDKLDADGGGTLSMDEFVKVYKAMMLKEAAKKDPSRQKQLDQYLATKVHKVGTALNAVLAFQHAGQVMSRTRSTASLKKSDSNLNETQRGSLDGTTTSITAPSLGNKLKSWAKKRTSIAGPEARHKALGKQLKSWKRDFAEQNGRDPTTADIEADPEMATVYKEYTEQQSGETPRESTEEPPREATEETPREATEEPPRVEGEDAEKRHKALGKQLKAWKKEFAAKNGREPTIADIEADVEMNVVYREYQGLPPEPPPVVVQDTPRTDEDADDIEAYDDFGEGEEVQDDQVEDLFGAEFDEQEAMQQKLEERMASIRNRLDKKTTPRGNLDGSVNRRTPRQSKNVGAELSEIREEESTVPEVQQDEGEGEKKLEEGETPSAEVTTVLNNMNTIYDKWTLIRQLSEKGSPSDEDLKKLELEHVTLGKLKESLVTSLGNYPAHSVNVPPQHEITLGDFVEEIVKETDLKTGNTNLLQALVSKLTLDFPSLVEERGLLANAACDSSLSFVKVLLDIPNVRFDMLELASSCFYNQAARIPLTLELMKHPNAVNFTAVADELSEMWQEFFEDIASTKRAIPHEDRTGRIEVLKSMLNTPGYHIDVDREGVDQQTILSRASYEGDADLVSVLLPNTKNINLIKGDGMTVLMQATIGNNPKVVEMIFEKYGSTVDVKPVSKEYGNVMDLAVNLARKKEIVDLLKKHGAKATGGGKKLAPKGKKAPAAKKGGKAPPKKH